MRPSAPPPTGQRIGLVDEQNPVEGLCHLVLHQFGCLADGASNQLRAIHLHQLVLAQQRQLVEQAADMAGDGGLARTGRPTEHHVKARIRDRQVAILLELDHPREIDQPADLQLYRVQADHRVNLVDDRLQIVAAATPSACGSCAVAPKSVLHQPLLIDRNPRSMALVIRLGACTSHSGCPCA